MAKAQKYAHENFINYQQKLVEHENYKGIPYKTDKNGEIKWVSTAKSDIGKNRIIWLDGKRKELDIEKVDGWRAKTALAIHPTKKKPCMICGEEMWLEYVYPNINFVKAMHKEGFELSTLDDIREFISLESMENNSMFFDALSNVFKVKIRPQAPMEKILQLGARKKMFGPGAMSNFPDRLDGFHSYNRCCRSKEDKGRAKENMNRYGQDRRAYENWSEGNWKAADRLMKEFNKHGVSADHIGPISLGFRHDPHFQPMNLSQQSTKGNRMTYKDVQKLIQREESGEEVISWHSKYIWDNLKYKINNDTEAKKASSNMRRNVHFVLNLLSKIYVNSQNGEDFLTNMVLEKQLKYANADYKFNGFDPRTGYYEEMVCKTGNRKEYSNNAERYKRKAFESLDKYTTKDNRWYADFTFEEYEEEIEFILNKIEIKKYDEAFEMIKNILNDFASKSFNNL